MTRTPQDIRLCGDHLLRHSDNKLYVCLQQIEALVQLASELVRVGHLHTSGRELQEQLLHACVLFLDEAQHLGPECTQVYMVPLLLLLRFWLPTHSYHHASNASMLQFVCLQSSSVMLYFACAQISSTETA